MSADRALFLEGVRRYIQFDPEAAAYVSDSVQAGLSGALDEARTRAADMEVALAVSLSRRVSQKDNEIIRQKLAKWVGKSSLEWKWFLEERE